MELDYLKIEEITLGAVRTEVLADGMHFYRFTKEQELLYKDRRDEFFEKSFSTSGIRFRFRTDSENLFMHVAVTPGSSRKYFSFDVFVNGKMVDCLNNFSHEQLEGDYTKYPFPLGEFAKTIQLGEGTKEVCVYFPWSVKAVIKSVALDDDAFAEPVKPSKKILCFGDSITHGYDALHPSNKYISRLADSLGAEEYNKGIGGEMFFPGLAASREGFTPDYITVAYGTNDWNHCTQEEFCTNCGSFLSNLSINYPNSPIFVITPIWRKELNEYRAFGPFTQVAERIKKLAEKHKNIAVIDGFGFVPQDEAFFADFKLHPNDRGFDCYFGNLTKQIKAILSDAEK